MRIIGIREHQSALRFLMDQDTADRSLFYPLIERPQIFLPYFLCLLAKVQASEKRSVFEGISIGILDRVLMAKRFASFTALFNDMSKTNYGGAVRYAVYLA